MHMPVPVEDRGIKSPGAGVIGGRELPRVGSGK